jgi:cytochrome P450
MLPEVPGYRPASSDDRDIRNNLVGIIVGALPQPPMMIPQLFDILLDRSLEFAVAQQAANADDEALVAKHVFEASRFYPLAPALFREALDDYRLAGGSWRARAIAKGTQVCVVLRSAVFDGRRVDNPKDSHAMSVVHATAIERWN